MKVVSKADTLFSHYKILTFAAVSGVVLINAVSVFLLKIPGAVELMPTFRSWLWKQVEICVALPLAFGVFWAVVFAVCRMATWEISASGVEARLAGIDWYRYGLDDIESVCFMNASVVLMLRRGRLRYLPFVGKDDVRDIVPPEKQRDFTSS